MAALPAAAAAATAATAETGAAPVLRREDWASIARAGRRTWLEGLRAPTPDADVAEIVARVRRDGDAALRALAREIDGVELDDLFVPSAEIDVARDEVTAALRDALVESSSAIRRYHAEQRAAIVVERRVRTRPGVVAWRRWVPLERAGGYVPGGRARYPSSVLMLGIPAQLAGVEELLIATPPGADGRVDAGVRFAASLVGVRRILRVGGAQAIAALAYGTESVPRVDRIFGAGNAWVTSAKRLVSADVAIDLPAGPSECVIVADDTADPDFVAADLLAQAEHGPDSLAVLVTTDAGLAASIDARVVEQAARLATGARALATLRAWGRIILVTGTEVALEVADAIAPEHLSLQCRDADGLANRARNAGAIFVGPWSAVAAADYATGSNHVLPTGGAARAYGGVGVETFGRWVAVQSVTSAGVTGLADAVDAIGAAEGLPAHAASVRLRADRAKTAEPAGRTPGRAGTAGTSGTPGTDDPLELLRRPGPVQPYVAEPSDDDLAASLGVPDVVRFDLSTLAEPLPGLVEALRAYRPARSAGYGDMAYRRLRAVLGDRHGVDPSRILPGAGADELIRLVATATLGPGDAALIPTPSFGMFPVETRHAGGRVVEVPRLDLARRQPVAELRAAAARESIRLVWLCTPNNPTGDRYPLEDVAALAGDLPAIVLVDEVYQEFAEADSGEAPGATSAIRLQAELPNILVLRSLSKAYAMAGARVGYLVLPEPLAERFDALRLPESVADLSEAMALGALADEDAARAMRFEAVSQRRRLAAALDELGCRTLPSVTNFVAFRPPDASALAAALARRGMIVREYDAGPMAGWLRAGALDEARTGRLIDAIRAALA